MAYLVRFSEGSQEFELAIASLEGAQALVDFLTRANAKDVTVWTPDGDLVYGSEDLSKFGRTSE